MLYAFTWAQCPTSITISSVTVTAATCNDNGTAVVNSTTGSNIQYRLVAGPTGYPTGAQASSTFSSLKPGNYTVRTECITDNSVYDEETFTIVDNYTPISFNATATGVCTNYTAGGTIVFNNIQGSSALEYAVLKSNNPSEPNSSFTWTPLTTGATTASIAVNNFGKYQVRIKDACGEIRNVEVELIESVPAATIGFKTDQGYYDCTTKYMSIVSLKDASNNNVLATNYKIELWYNVDCSNVNYSTTPDLTKTNPQPNANLFVPMSATKVAWRITSICGATTTGCMNLTTPTLAISYSMVMGCMGDNNSVLTSVQSNSIKSVIITGYDGPNATGTIVYSETKNTPPPYTGIKTVASYKIETTDICGNKHTFIYTQSTLKDIASIQNSLFCTDVTGATGVIIDMRPGIEGFALLTNADVKLVSTTGTTEYHPFNLNPPLVSRAIEFKNVLPGTYKLKLDLPCGTDLEYDVTVTGPVFAFNIAATTTALCGSTGGAVGSIIASMTGSTVNPSGYKLYNSSGTVIATNNNGTFQNLPAGNYTVAAYISASPCKPLYEVSTPVTLLAPNAPPIVDRKSSFICDADNTKGIASFHLTGNPPFKVYTGTSLNPSTWNLVATITTNDYLANNLTAGQTYFYKFEDACGNAVTEQLDVNGLANIQLETTNQPCVGSPYVLEYAYIPGAMYEWSKGGTIVSTSNKYQIASYNASMDGTYTCKITIGTCIVITKTIDLESNKCGGSLSANFGDITAKMESGQLLVDWTTLSETNVSYFDIEASKDGKTFSKIGTIRTKATDGSSSQSLAYSFKLDYTSMNVVGMSILFLSLGVAFTRRKKLAVLLTVAAISIFAFSACNKAETSSADELSKADIFIRIKQVDKDGSIKYSKVIKVVK